MKLWERELKTEISSLKTQLRSESQQRHQLEAEAFLTPGYPNLYLTSYSPLGTIIISPSSAAAVMTSPHHIMISLLVIAIMTSLRARRGCH